MLGLESSVGALGRNLPHDVAIIQLALKILHRGQNGSGPYYKGLVHGQMDGPTTGAIRLFFKHFSEEVRAFYKIKINQASPVFRPYDAMHRELIYEVQMNSIWRGLSVIRGTPFFYWRRAVSAKPRDAKEFLIPDFMKPKRLFKIGKVDEFQTFFEEVRLLNNDHFEVDFSFGRVSHFMNPMTTRKEQRPSSKKLLSHLALNLRGSGWKLVANSTSKKGHFTLVSAQPSGLRRAIKYWRQQDVYSRVFADGEKHHLIPSHDDAQDALAKAQIGVCFARFGDGPKPPGYEKLAKYVDAVPKKDARVKPQVWEAHCKGCSGLLADAMAYSNQIEALEQEIAKLGPRREQWRRHVAVIQSYEELDFERKKKLADAAFSAWSIPLEGDAVFTRDIDDIVVGDDDLVEFIGRTTHELGPQKPMLLKLARSTILLSELMALADVVEANFRAIQVIDLKDEYQEAVGWMRAEWPYLKQQIVGLQYNADGIRLQLESLLWRRAEMGCGTG